MIDRDNDLDPLFSRRSLLMRTDGSAVDHLNVTVVRGGNSVHHPIPNTRLPPSHEAAVARRARTIALRQVAPRRSRAQHPENAVQHAPIIDARHASGFIRQQWLDNAPFEIGQVISAHAHAESEAGDTWKSVPATGPLENTQSSSDDWAWNPAAR